MYAVLKGFEITPDHIIAILKVPHYSQTPTGLYGAGIYGTLDYRHSSLWQTPYLV